MSGKSAGKKRNRAAQSEPHGYQEHPGERAEKDRKTRGPGRNRPAADTGERQRVTEKMRDLEQRRRDKEAPGRDKEAPR
jgi:hypothetical protein